MRTILWKPVTGNGLETLHLRRRRDGATADGVVLRQDEGDSYRLRYRVTSDAAEHTRELAVELLARHPKRLLMIGDGEGSWRTGEGAPLPELSGCIDIGLTATPYPHTLPIRRLRLSEGESRELMVATVIVPSLELRRDRLRYTCLERPDGTARYRYQNLDTGFRVELTVDGYGLVIDCPGYYRRVS